MCSKLWHKHQMCLTISFFMLKLCLATTIWPLTKYKVCQTPLICMDWMWYEFHEGGEPHVITYHAYAQCKQSYCGVWGHHCWHEQYSVVTSLWLPTTVLGAKTLLIYIIWKYRPLYSDPSPQPCHSGITKWVYNRFEQGNRIKAVTRQFI